VESSLHDAGFPNRNPIMPAHLHVMTFPFRTQLELGLSTGASVTGAGTGATGVTGEGETVEAGRIAPITVASARVRSNLTV